MPNIFPITKTVQLTHLILLDEWDEGCSLDLDWLAGAVVEGDDEVEEVGLPQVGGRLLLEVGPPDSGCDTEPEVPEIGLKIEQAPTVGHRLFV